MVLPAKAALKKQMRNKLKNKNILKITSLIVFAAVITFIAAQNGFCANELVNHVPDIQQQTADSKGDTIAKFLIAMGGVMLSSFVIYLGLTIYNKFFVDKSLFPNNDPDDVLNTPKTIDEAVTLFIKRNKLC